MSGAPSEQLRHALSEIDDLIGQAKECSTALGKLIHYVDRFPHSQEEQKRFRSVMHYVQSDLDSFLMRAQEHHLSACRAMAGKPETPEEGRAA